MPCNHSSLYILWVAIIQSLEPPVLLSHNFIRWSLSGSKLALREKYGKEVMCRYSGCLFQSLGPTLTTFAWLVNQSYECWMKLAATRDVAVFTWFLPETKLGTTSLPTTRTYSTNVQIMMILTNVYWNIVTKFNSTVIYFGTVSVGFPDESRYITYPNIS